MDIKIGTAPDSWGVWFPQDDKQIPWDRCLDEMYEAGYEGIELGPWGYLPNDYEKLSTELNKRNLELVATTLAGDLMSKEKTAQMVSQLDEMAHLQLKFPSAKYVILIDDCYTNLFTGEQVRQKNLNEQEWKLFIENIKHIADYAKEKYGLEVLFHPHAESHIETEEQIEALLNETTLNLCLDTGHHVYANGDAVEFMKKHYERIPYLHVKSCDMKVKDEMLQKGWPFAKAVSEGVMCEPDLGEVDMEEFFKVLSSIQYRGWLVVEQDMYPVPFDQPFPIAKRTKNYLVRLMSQMVNA